VDRGVATLRAPGLCVPAGGLSLPHGRPSPRWPAVRLAIGPRHPLTLAPGSARGAAGGTRRTGPRGPSALMGI
jgi:hypothetical protein